MKEGKFRYKNVVMYGIAGIIVIVFVISIIGRFTQSKLGEFPFESDVWGTVSDYFNLILVAISIFFLWKTLEKQVEATNENNKLIKAQLDEFNFLKIQRRLMFDYNTEVNVVNSETDESGYIEIYNKGDDIFNLDIVVRHDLVVLDSILSKYVPANCTSAKQLWNLKKNVNRPARLTIQNINQLKTFSIRFRDVYGLEYGQKFFKDDDSGKYWKTHLAYIK